jgi:hypothetical protein
VTRRVGGVGGSSSQLSISDATRGTKASGSFSLSLSLVCVALFGVVISFFLASFLLRFSGLLRGSGACVGPLFRAQALLRTVFVQPEPGPCAALFAPTAARHGPVPFLGAFPADLGPPGFPSPAFLSACAPLWRLLGAPPLVPLVVRAPTADAATADAAATVVVESASSPIAAAPGSSSSSSGSGSGLLSCRPTARPAGSAKTFAGFLSHFKLECGTEARLVHDMLAATLPPGDKIFLDSGKLFTCVCRLAFVVVFVASAIVCTFRRIIRTLAVYLSTVRAQTTSRTCTCSSST